MLNTEELSPQPQPALDQLLQKEKLLFSKEIEVMYDLEQAEAVPFIEKHLPRDDYEIKEILGEKYVEAKE